MECIFCFSVAMIIYAYFGYPIILYGLSLVRRKTVKRDNRYIPPLTLIITVHNEERRVQEKIDNTLSLDYPADKLEIIFASDASTDKTDSIVQSYPQFKLVRSSKRQGKEFAQKCAVEASMGEVLVFSDVATMLEPDGLKAIASNFADSEVGCVSSEDRFIDAQGRVSGEGAYVKYEMLLRRLETRVYSVVGLSGSFFAARREACENWAEDLQSDFNTLLNSLKLGLRGVTDPLSLGWYRNISDERKEFNRKVRTVLRGLTVLMRNLSLMNVFQYGLFSWELFSHKLCRWLVPFFLLIAFITNAYISSRASLYSVLLLIQILFYLLAIGHVVLEFSVGRSQKRGFIHLSRIISRIPYYFFIVNAAIFMAWLKFFKGERAIYWEPSKR